MEIEIGTNSKLMDLTIRVWNPTIQIDNGGEVRLIKRSKTLINPEYLKTISEISSGIRSYCARKTVPFPIRGILRVPLQGIDQFEEGLCERTMQFNRAVNSFIDCYDEAKRDAQDRLGRFYNDDDYPTYDVVRDKFSVTRTYFEVVSPGNVVTGSIEAFNEMMSEAKRMATDFLRTRFAEMVERIATNLSDPGKVFKSSSIENFKEFLDDFRLLNVANDSDLQALVSRCKVMFTRVDSEMIRSDEQFRERLGRAMTVVNAQVSQLSATRERQFVSL